ncbi:MAG: glycerol-3-phosphate dehydrogenase/oxidase [Pyrinomonadaceae bacterium]
MNRDKNLLTVREKSEPWDVVVIGGGATGAGCALDAASRGFSVLLLEQHDFGKGTSSRSTKLIHGGIRYLRQGNISLVREALRERGIVLATAPHIVHLQDFVVPCYSRWQKLFYGAGLRIYDHLAGKLSTGRSRILSREETIRRLPNLKADGLRGGVLYSDGQFDDTRLLIDILQTAESHGAIVLNYARASALQKSAAGRIEAVEFIDQETGERLVARARSVINATGVFCDAVRQMSDERAERVVTYSHGIHLVLPRDFLPTDTAIMISKTTDGRVLFCIPWQEHLLVGTTDTAIDTASLEPHALESEIEFVLKTAGEYLEQKPTRDDVLSVFAGTRPLIRSSTQVRTSSLSRGHDLFVDKSGLITIIGGKWTTYRRMAEDAVDKAVEIAGLEYRQCRTETLSIDPPQVRSGERLYEDLPYTDRDVVRAVSDEMARTVEDVLARRTRVLFLDAKTAERIAPTVAQIMAAELGRDELWQQESVKEFARVARGYSVETDS